MHLSDLSMHKEWAIKADALDAWLDSLAKVVSLASDQSNGTQPLRMSCGTNGTEPQTTDLCAGFSITDSNASSADCYQLQGSVAVIDVSGVIYKQAGAITSWLGTFSWAGHDGIRSAVTKALDDQKVHAILLSFDSPGGVAQGVNELATFIASQTSKPLYAYVDGLCASAAYWLASATGRIYAPLTAEVGSIGVVSRHCDHSVANAKAGHTITYISAGSYKTIGNPDTPLSDSDRFYLQNKINALHEVFKNDVSSHMPVDKNTPHLWGEAQVFLAQEAKERGLITDIVSDRDALLTHIHKEICMDKQTLATSHPELLAQIESDAQKRAMEDAKTQVEATLATNKESCLAAVEALCGQEIRAKVAGLLEANFSAEQIRTMATTFPLVVKPQAAELAELADLASRENILNAIQQGTPAPLSTSVAMAEGDPMQTAIDSIVGMKKR